MIADGVVHQVHQKSTVFADAKLLIAFDGLAGFQDCFACFFLIRIVFSQDGDANKILFRQGMCRHGILVLLQTDQEASVLFDLAGKLLEQLILQTVLIALVIRFHQAQACHIHVQRHLLLDAVIPGAEGFDFSVGKRRFVHVLTGAHRRF